MRTVPVLSVAKEAAALPAGLLWTRCARTHAGRSRLTDQRLSAKKLLSFVCLLMFPYLLEVIVGRELPMEGSEPTCFAKVNNRHGTWQHGDTFGFEGHFTAAVSHGPVQPRESSLHSSSKEHTTRAYQVLVNYHDDGQTFKFRPRPAQEFQFQFLFFNTWTQSDCAC